MTLSGLIQDLHSHISGWDPRRFLAELTQLDRPQASDGIVKAAKLVAEEARRRGVANIKVRYEKADGERRWWDWRAPMSWTPLAASMRLARDRQPIVDYSRDPMGLATNSAPISRAEVRLAHMGETSTAEGFHNSIVILPAGTSVRACEARLAANGALGIVTRAPPRCAPHVLGATGRVELSRQSQLAGFSVDYNEYRALLGAYERKEPVLVEVDIHRSAPMPLTVGTVGADDPTREILLIAHICHRAPGANDNASGVATLLMVAYGLAGFSDRTGGFRFSFLWAPELLGSAAWLYKHREEAIRDRLELAISLDMVGRRPTAEHPLVVERPPTYCSSIGAPLIDKAIRLAHPGPSGYTGAPLYTEPVSSSPFIGASDHSLFPTPGIAVPGMAVGQWPDPPNHTNRDISANLDIPSMRRTASAVGASLLWIADEASDHRGQHKGASDVCVLERAITSLEHRHISQAALFGDHPNSLKKRLHHERMHAASLRLAAGQGLTRPTPSIPLTIDAVQEASDEVDREGVMHPGPFDLISTLERCSRKDREWFFGRWEADRSTYTKAITIAHLAQSGYTIHQLLANATLATGLVIQKSFVSRFLRILRSSISDRASHDPDRPTKIG